MGRERNLASSRAINPYNNRKNSLPDLQVRIMKKERGKRTTNSMFERARIWDLKKENTVLSGLTCNSNISL